MSDFKTGDRVRVKKTGEVIRLDDVNDNPNYAADERGFTVIHDGMPFVHDRAWWIENANVNDAEDCEACVDDLCPVHHGMAVGIDFVTKKIAALGEDPELFNSIPNPPKAPGGDDE